MYHRSYVFNGNKTLKILGYASKNSMESDFRLAVVNRKHRILYFPISRRCEERNITNVSPITSGVLPISRRCEERNITNVRPITSGVLPISHDCEERNITNVGPITSGVLAYPRSRNENLFFPTSPQG